MTKCSSLNLKFRSRAGPGSAAASISRSFSDLFATMSIQAHSGLLWVSTFTIVTLYHVLLRFAGSNQELSREAHQCLTGKVRAQPSLFLRSGPRYYDVYFERAERMRHFDNKWYLFSYSLRSPDRSGLMTIMHESCCPPRSSKFIAKLVIACFAVRILNFEWKLHKIRRSCQFFECHRLNPRLTEYFNLLTWWVRKKTLCEWFQSYHQYI